MILSSACWTPSPETSRVIEGLSALRVIFVDFVDVDDPSLRAGDVELRRLDQVQQDVFDVLADVAGLGEGGGVGDREGNVEDAGESGGEQRLAGTPVGPTSRMLLFSSSTPLVASILLVIRL